MSCRSEYTYTTHFHFLHSVHIWSFPSRLQSPIMKMEAVSSRDVVNQLLHHLAQQTCMYQCHLTPAASKVLILTVSPVQSIRLWRVLKFLLWSNMCVRTVPNCVFIKEYSEQPLKPIFHSGCRKQNSLLLNWQRPPYRSQMFNKTASPQPPPLLSWLLTSKIWTMVVSQG